ncbi:MAG: SPOR domain-containing protein [Pseudomonadota bacterium]
MGIFSLESNADGAAAQLRGDGMVASVREQSSDGTTFWRVVVGPAPNAADRTAILSKVQALGFSDAYFVSN